MSAKMSTYAIEKLKEKPVAGPVSETALLAAEQNLRVHFPPSYRQFLGDFGAGTIGYYEIFGLSETEAPNEPPLWRNVVKETMRSRKSGTIPVGFIVFTSDGQGCRFFLDTSRTDSGGECPVIAWGPGVEGVVVAASFLEFVERASKGLRLPPE
jgi:SMI1-KNR4 cell-wall